MGRYYRGSISGKFWFGIQCSGVLVDLFEFIPEEELCFVGCGCTFYPEDNPEMTQADAWCVDCYENREQHVCEAETQELCVENESIMNCVLENNDDNKKMIKSKLGVLERAIRTMYKVPDDKTIKEFLSFEIVDEEYEVDIEHIQTSDNTKNNNLFLVADWCLGQQVLDFLENNEWACGVSCDL